MKQYHSFQLLEYLWAIRYVPSIHCQPREKRMVTVGLVWFILF